MIKLRLITDHSEYLLEFDSLEDALQYIKTIFNWNKTRLIPENLRVCIEQE